MKKILTAAVALAVCYRLRPIKAYAWSGTTHEDIVKKSLALLEKEKKQKQVTFYKDYHSEILKGCTQPDDENDMDKGHGKHYYSCVNPKGKELPETNGKPVQFRVTALGKRRFRISTESTDYVKVLANSKGGKLSFADLEPENSTQIWILN